MDSSIDNAGYITIWQINEANSNIRYNTNSDWNREMEKIRRTHICHLCKKYPGDQHFSFGKWNNNKYCCFNCRIE